MSRVQRELEILYIESNDDDVERALQTLRDGGFLPQAERVADEESYRQALEDRAWDLVLSEVDVNGFSALRALSLLHRTDQRIPFILVTDNLTEEAAVQCLEFGANNLVHKRNLKRLPLSLSRTMERYEESMQTEHLHRQLRQAQKMEAIGRLAGGVAHDFNNLLTVIQGYGNILKRRLVPRGEMVEEISELLGATDRAAALTRQLLAFSRSQALRPQVVSIGDSVRNLRKIIGRLMGEEYRMVIDIAEDAGHVRADPTQLGQVMMNLAVNARDAMPDGGTLTVRATSVVLAPGDIPEEPGLRAGAYVRLEFSDTGVGIDPVTQRQIFEPFFTTKGVGKGTGLGLSTVYGIVRQSKGAIRVVSSVGRGTTFEILLPQVSPEEAKSESLNLVGAQRGGESILFVEDDTAVRGLFSAELKDAGFDMLVASTGEDAIEMMSARERPVNLVVSDVILPGMRGPAMMERLRMRWPEQRVLFVSGYQNPERTRLPEIDDNNGFLQKPFTPDQLVEKIRAMLDG